MDLSESSQLEPVTNSTETQSSNSSDSITVREKLRECFKPRYRPRSVKNKGAILVIVWGFLTTSLYSNLFYFVTSTYSKPVYTALIIAFGLTIPFAGWLADVRFGRYKIISSSIWIMWISALLLTIGQLVLQLVGVSNMVYFYKYLIIFAILFNLEWTNYTMLLLVKLRRLLCGTHGAFYCSGLIVDMISMYASDKFKILAYRY